MSRPHAKRLKLMYQIKVTRNGEEVYKFKRTRDLLMWRGQMILAYLLSQGVVGTSTGVWSGIISSNDTAPDMGDDSGDPENNEFNPVIGSLQPVEYFFIPDIKTSGGYQCIAELRIHAGITVTANDTLRKIGIIDDVAVPNRHIIVADMVVPYSLESGDRVDVTYFIQLG